MLPFAAVPILQASRDARSAAYARVVPGRTLHFPDDEGSHPDFKTEWWYATGWLTDEAKRPMGFQITFYRTRAVDLRGNPSRFAPEQIVIAHAALSDPERGHLLHDQRIARAGFGLADAAQGKTDIKIDNWYLRTQGETMLALVTGRELRFELTLRPTQPPLLHGDHGFSRKGSAPESASFYYTLPQLAVDGGVYAEGRTTRITGTAWFDHEWSTAPMESEATGWEWIGINLDDGSVLMAFRIRSRSGDPLWAGATLRSADGRTKTFAPQEVGWQPIRNWRSDRTGTSYPVAWRVYVGDFVIDLEPLMDDQEHDARISTGTVYWEGAVTVRSGDRSIGRGYLELTGYWRAFRL